MFCHLQAENRYRDIHCDQFHTTLSGNLSLLIHSDIHFHREVDDSKLSGEIYGICVFVELVSDDNKNERLQN